MKTHPAPAFTLRDRRERAIFDSCQETKKDKPSASARRTSPRRAGHRRLGGTATDTRREGRGTEARCWGASDDSGSGRYSLPRFWRNVRGGSLNNKPRKQRNYKPRLADYGCEMEERDGVLYRVFKLPDAEPPAGRSKKTRYKMKDVGKDGSG